MQQQKHSQVSVVIPCFNEGENIVACLKSLEAQTVKPLEIITVDNNCTDATVKLASKFRGVVIVKESKQGLVAARNAGMNAAKGSIIARLDADSRPAADWLAKLETIFKNKKIQAVTGTGYFYDAPCKILVKTYRNIFAVWLNRMVLGHHMLWGSNMAVRASAWRQIRPKVCSFRDIMEDLDIAAHINKQYGSAAISYNPHLWVDISGRRAMVNLKRNWGYLKMWPYTLSLHNYQRRILLWPAIAVLLASMTFGSKIARFYNNEEQRFIFTLNQWRSNPLYTRGNP